MSASERQCRRVSSSIIEAGGDLAPLGATGGRGLGHGGARRPHPRQRAPRAWPTPPTTRPSAAPQLCRRPAAALRDLLPETSSSTWMSRAPATTVGAGRAALAAASSIARSSPAWRRRACACCAPRRPSCGSACSVPEAGATYLSHPLTPAPAAYAMLAYLRRVLPGRAARALRRGPGRRDHDPLGGGDARAGQRGARRRRRALCVDGGRRPAAAVTQCPQDQHQDD